MDLRDTALECYLISKQHGFWDVPRNKAEMIALIHSELSEMLEGVRKPGPDAHCPAFSSEAIELADVVIRVLDYSAGFHIDLAAAVRAKMNYNRSREYMHGKAF